MTGTDPRTTRTLAVDLTVRVLAAAGLAVDAYVHADLASRYDPISADISQGTLFRVEAAFAALAALLLVVWWGRLSAAFAFLVAAGGLALLLIYRYNDIGAFGPFPDMYEPVWYTEKVVAVVAQAVAVLGSLYLLLVGSHRGRHRGEPRVA